MSAGVAGAVVAGAVVAAVAPSGLCSGDVFAAVPASEPALAPSFSVDVDEGPLTLAATEGGLRGVGGGGLEGLGGREGLQFPLVSNGESLPLTVLFSLAAASSELSRLLELVRVSLRTLELSFCVGLLVVEASPLVRSSGSTCIPSRQTDKSPTTSAGSLSPTRCNVTTTCSSFMLFDFSVS